MEKKSKNLSQLEKLQVIIECFVRGVDRNTWTLQPGTSEYCSVKFNKSTRQVRRIFEQWKQEREMNINPNDILKPKKKANVGRKRKQLPDDNDHNNNENNNNQPYDNDSDSNVI